MKLITLQSVDSTNSYARAIPPDQLPAAVIAHAQTAGRGQRGNHWESLPGANITLSAAVVPAGIHPRDQFAVSRAVSLAVVDTIRQFLPSELASQVSIKWPNDIYIGDRKVCGILIEHVITGTAISRSVIGIGLNVNQTRFLSDAPNPVSLAQLTGNIYPVDEIASSLIANLEQRLNQESLDNGSTKQPYMSSLYRRDGLHRYALPDGTEFLASIADVEPSGLLHLLHADGSLSVHPFKSVAFCI